LLGFLTPVKPLTTFFFDLVIVHSDSSLKQNQEPLGLFSPLFLKNCFYCFAGGTLWHLQKFSQYIKYIQIHPLHHSPLSLTHSWNSFNRSHFSIYNTCTQYLHYIHPPTPFSRLLPPPTGTTTPLTGTVLPSCSLIL
jgi:hypothetical protein